MANLYNNISITRLTGPFSDPFVNRKTRLGKIILASKPRLDDNRDEVKTSKAHLAAVREATTYANFAKTQDVYINKARRTGATPYYIALADWFGEPKVLEIDVDDWSGEIGQTIHVKARDNIMVVRVTVVIRDTDENVLEMGEAVQSATGSAWWNYTTKSHVKMAPFPIVEATAEDLPGNCDSFVIS